LTEMQLG